MIKDHRPHCIKKADMKIQEFYTRRFIRPQFQSLGEHAVFIKPWYVEIFGPSIRLGRHAHLVATTDLRIRLSSWSTFESRGSITFGDYCLICPGVRISASAKIEVGDSCMLASKVYVTDSDWHGLYDRVSPGAAHPVCIENNVWIGDSTIVCKGVSIGENSIIGAGSVVAKSIPPNSVAAGNPAEVVKELDPEKQVTAREAWFSDPIRLKRDFEMIDREMLKGNTVGSWVRHLFRPRRGD